jgi:hypothetical protein
MPLLREQRKGPAIFWQRIELEGRALQSRRDLGWCGRLSW